MECLNPFALKIPEIRLYWYKKSRVNYWIPLTKDETRLKSVNSKLVCKNASKGNVCNAIHEQINTSFNMKW